MHLTLLARRLDKTQQTKPKSKETISTLASFFVCVIYTVLYTINTGSYYTNSLDAPA